MTKADVEGLSEKWRHFFAIDSPAINGSIMSNSGATHRGRGLVKVTKGDMGEGESKSRKN